MAKDKDFKVMGTPIGKGRPKFTSRGGYARAYTPKKTREYEEKVANAYKELYGEEKTDKPVELVVIATFPIPTSFRKAEKEKARLGEIMPAKKPDIDNIVKSVMDGLNGVAYEDDAQVIRVIAKKRYVTEIGEEGHLLVSIKEM